MHQIAAMFVLCDQQPSEPASSKRQVALIMEGFFVPKKQVIVITDGDHTAYRAVAEACEGLGLDPVDATEGNPTPIQGQALLQAIYHASGNPVVAMVDDRGSAKKGRGERDLGTILDAEELDVLGVIAVAANTPGVKGVVPDLSIDHDAERVSEAVDKQGNASGHVLRGDTVDVLRNYPDVTVIGLGDPGKMGGDDAVGQGAPVTAQALKTILRNRGGDPPTRD
jgi:stage V sporulation protein AE